VSRTVTLSQLRTDIEYQCDVVGATSRHPTSLKNRLINQAIQRFREKISNAGAQHFLTSATGSLGTGATSPYPFYVLDLTAVSPGLVRTYGLDLTVSGEVESLLHVPFNDRDKYLGPHASVPVAWANFQTAKVAIFPPSQSAYTYVVWYLPVFTDLSSDGDTFDGVAGWEDFIVWEVCTRLIARDTYPEAWQIANAHKDSAWRDIVTAATKVSSAGGATIGRDSLGQRLRGMRRSRRLPPPP
jgi:hypothetical protein